MAFSSSGTCVAGALARVAALGAVPEADGYCWHHPRLLRNRPAQQSAVEEAAPSAGTQVVRQRWSWLVALEPQKGALAQHSERALQSSPAGLQTGGAAQTPALVQVRVAQQVPPPLHEPPEPMHGDTQTPELLRTRPAQHSELLCAAMPAPAQVERQVSVDEAAVPTQ